MTGTPTHGSVSRVAQLGFCCGGHSSVSVSAPKDRQCNSLMSVLCCSEEQRLASELDYLVFRRILTPLQVRRQTVSSLLSVARPLYISMLIWAAPAQRWDATRPLNNFEQHCRAPGLCC
jgi:dienelactone hydrolase